MAERGNRSEADAASQEQAGNQPLSGEELAAALGVASDENGRHEPIKLSGLGERSLERQPPAAGAAESQSGAEDQETAESLEAAASGVVGDGDAEDEDVPAPVEPIRRSPKLGSEEEGPRPQRPRRPRSRRPRPATEDPHRAPTPENLEPLVPERARSAAEPLPPPEEQPEADQESARRAIWHGGKDGADVEVIGEPSSYGQDPERYYQVKGSNTRLPESQLEFLDEPAASPRSPTIQEVREKHGHPGQEPPVAPNATARTPRPPHPPAPESSPPPPEPEPASTEPPHPRGWPADRPAGEESLIGVKSRGERLADWAVTQPEAATPPAQAPISAELPDTLELHSINLDAAVRQRAVMAAESRLETEAAAAHGVKRLVHSIWHNNYAREYYRQKYAAEAAQAIRYSGNLYATEGLDQEAHTTAMQAVVDRLTRSQHGLSLEEEGDRVAPMERSETTEVFQDSVKGLIRRYVDGELDAEALGEERTRLLAEFRATHPDLLEGARMTADNLIQVAEQAKAMVDNGHGLDRLLDQMRFYEDQAKLGARTEVHRTAVDKVVERIYGSKLGSLVNESTVAFAVAAVYSAVTAAGKGGTSTALRTVAPLVPGAGGALIAGAREHFRYSRDREQHMRQAAEGAQFETSGRRATMERTRYQTKSVAELLTGLDVAGGAELSTATLTTDQAEALLKSFAEIQARQQLSDMDTIDLISYSAVDRVEPERLGLALKMAEAQVALERWFADSSPGERIRMSHHRDLDAAIGQAMITAELAITQDVRAKDRTFTLLKARAVANAAAKGFLIGGTIGIAAQEITAGLDGNLQGAAESLFHHDALHGTVTEHQTLLRSLLGGGSTTHHAAGAALPTHGSSGPEQSAVPILTHHNETLHTSVGEYVHEHPHGTVHVERTLFYDNNTPGVADGNELRLDWGGHNATGLGAHGNYEFSISHMTADGSSHDGLSANAQTLMREGRLRILLSANEASQSHPFSIAIDTHGNATITHNSALGRSLFADHGGRATFEGRYAEVAQVVGHHAGREQVCILATAEGHGVNAITHTETVATVEHHAPAVPKSGQLSGSTPRTGAASMPGAVGPAAVTSETPPLPPVYFRREMQSPTTGAESAPAAGTTPEPTAGGAPTVDSEAITRRQFILGTTRPTAAAAPAAASEPTAAPAPTPPTRQSTPRPTTSEQRPSVSSAIAQPETEATQPAPSTRFGRQQADHYASLIAAATTPKEVNKLIDELRQQGYLHKKLSQSGKSRVLAGKNKRSREILAQARRRRRALQVETQPAAGPQAAEATTPETVVLPEASVGQHSEADDRFVGEANQDQVRAVRGQGIYLVADGMGGEDGGELASKTVADAVVQRLTGVSTLAPERMEQVIVEAQAELQTAFANAGINVPGGTTLVGIKIIAPDRAVAFNVGDSLLMRIRDGQLTRLTPEQFDVNKPNTVWNAVGISRDENGRLQGNLRRGITSLTNTNYQQLQTHDAIDIISLQPGDRFILCSDGVTGDRPEQRLSDEEIAEAVAGKPAAEAANALAAISRKPDDTTALVVDIPANPATA